jgi:hypothetical protein
VKSVKESKSNLAIKDIVTTKNRKPNKAKVSDVAAKACTGKLCNCPNNEPGKIKLNIEYHQYGCRFWKKIWSGLFAVNTSVVPPKIKDGYGLGVVIGQEDF